MASSIIHLAITEILCGTYEYKDKNRLLLGSVLPDAAPKGNSHLKLSVCNGMKKTYDLTGFREAFLQKMLVDDLYLGYYLHLLQDLIFRGLIYGRYHWDPNPEGNIERLHRDYALTNRYVIEKYALADEITVPAAFESEAINQLCSFRIYPFIERISADFKSSPTGTIFFFTREMADELISDAAEKCKQEVSALFGNERCIDETVLAWEKV